MIRDLAQWRIYPRISAHQEGRGMARGFMEPIGCSDCGDCVPIEEAQARIEKLERMVVWCAKSYAADGRTSIGPCIYFSPDGSSVRGTIQHDGTPASILAAVEKAMGEK